MGGGGGVRIVEQPEQHLTSEAALWGVSVLNHPWRWEGIEEAGGRIRAREGAMGLGFP